MQELSLMERFADPATFETLSSGDKIVASLITTVLGMGVTFVILILLWIAIAIMARVLKTKTPVKEVPKAASAPVASTATGPVSDSINLIGSDSQTDTTQELIAVIMAAIAAKEGTEVISNLVIKRINRVSGIQTAWRAAGSADCIESRKI